MLVIQNVLLIKCFYKDGSITIQHLLCHPNHQEDEYLHRQLNQRIVHNQHGVHVSENDRILGPIDLRTNSDPRGIARVDKNHLHRNGVRMPLADEDRNSSALCDTVALLLRGPTIGSNHTIHPGISCHRRLYRINPRMA